VLESAARAFNPNARCSPVIMTTLAPGTLVADKYLIEQRLGSGAFAHVYRARHAKISSLHVALKVLRDDISGGKEAARRFLREAETAAALRGRHAVRVSDFGETEDGVPFIAMDLIHGEPLDAVLAREACLADVHVARIAAGVLRALEEAHALGIVHRDLKPANILMSVEVGELHPVPRVSDFGIAKIMPGAHADQNDAGSQMTAEGIVPCTPAYAAPELLRGNPSPASDLYALGLTMSELLDGVHPMEGGAPVEIAVRQLSPAAVPHGPNTTGSALWHIVERATAKDADLRFASATEMLAAIEPVLRTLEERDPSTLNVIAPKTRANVTVSIPTPQGRPAGNHHRHAPPRSIASFNPRTWVPIAMMLGVLIIWSAARVSSSNGGASVASSASTAEPSDGLRALIAPTFDVRWAGDNQTRTVEEAMAIVESAIRNTSTQISIQSNRDVVHVWINDDLLGVAPIQGPMLEPTRPITIRLVDGDDEEMTVEIEHAGPVAIEWPAAVAPTRSTSRGSSGRSRSSGQHGLFRNRILD